MNKTNYPQSSGALFFVLNINNYSSNFFFSLAINEWRHRQLQQVATYKLPHTGEDAVQNFLTNKPGGKNV